MAVAGNLMVSVGTPYRRRICLRYSIVTTISFLLIDLFLNNTHCAIHFSTPSSTIPAHRINLISQQIKQFLVKWTRRINYDAY